jgi:hypothetical protein
VGVPPLNEVVVLSVELPPLLIEAGDALMTGAIRTGFTVTVLLAQKLTAGVPVLLSVTFTEKVVVIVRVPVKRDGEAWPTSALPPAHPDPEYHWSE